MLEQGIDFLFNDVSLYTKEIFKVFELKENRYEYKLITYCHKCKKEFPFDIKTELFQFRYQSKSNIPCMEIAKIGQYGGATINMNNGEINGVLPPYDKNDFDPRVNKMLKNL